MQFKTIDIEKIGLNEWLNRYGAVMKSKNCIEKLDELKMQI
ncbi:hypothetical protein CBO05C_0644 [Clostridium botulinum B str. Osaka05]|uniref:Uncharacterized protein n=1 Tax=Clostridium botulinum B str. Osaka05 TaxID=1407017 RepID=A0A0S6U1I2_CLOBO|nr:hypothetical protein [Clostridium botulinum]GAE00954.1 hypothetical protein CBO05C_0644 [Clostridium botulinum B str. Osaka05]